MDHEVAPETRKAKAIRYERRFVLLSTPTLGLIAFAIFTWTDLSFWFWLCPGIGCVMGLIYILVITRIASLAGEIMSLCDLLYWCYLGICALVDLLGWVFGVIGALLAIGAIR